MAQIEIIPDSIQLLKMSDKEYFSKTDYLSNSKLGLLNPAQGGSLEAFEKGFQSKYSDSFELGSAVHCMLLQPDEFHLSSLDKPTGKLGLFINEIFKQRTNGKSIQEAIDIAKVDADYYVKSLSPKRVKTAMEKGLDYYIKRMHTSESEVGKELIYLSKPMREKFNHCMVSTRKDVKLMGKLNPDYLIEPNESFNEYAIFCSMQVTLDNGDTHIIKMKAKLDNFTLDHELGVLTLNDLKTTGKPAAYFMGNLVNMPDGEVWMNGSFQKYHYYRQMAVYLWMLNAAIKYERKLDYELKVNMLLIETIPEFSTRVCKVNGIHISKGLQQFKELIIYLLENGQH